MEFTKDGLGPFSFSWIRLGIRTTTTSAISIIGVLLAPDSSVDLAFPSIRSFAWLCSVLLMFDSVFALGDGAGVKVFTSVVLDGLIVGTLCIPLGGSDTEK